MQAKIKIFNTKYRFDYWLLLITPIIDTINGLFIIKHGATGLSIGTIYRFFLLIYIILRLCEKRTLFIKFIPLLYFPLLGIIRGITGENVFGCITYAMKWLLPLALILYYGKAKNDKSDIKKCLIRCLNFWSIFVPISLIFEYIFKIGNEAYYDAGFKGLYYSTNDIALVLIVLYIYSFYKTIDINHSYIIVSILNFIGIIILSTKSSIIFAVISSLYLLIRSKKIKISTLILGIPILCVISFFMISLMHTHLESFFLRYSNMWSNTEGSDLITRILGWATSGRTYRISSFFKQINDNGSFATNLFFGWIYPDNAHVIEMDWHDLICQYGLIGFAICFAEYLVLFTKSKIASNPYWYIVVVCMIYATLAGHVISGAFSGTAFAVAFALLLLDSDNIRKKNTK